VLGPRHETTQKLMHSLSVSLFVAAQSGSADKRLTEAEGILRELLAANSSVLSDKRRVGAMYTLSSVLQVQRKLPEAEALRRQLVELDKAGEVMQYVGWRGMADSLLANARVEEAEPILRAVYERYQRICGEERPQTSAAARLLASDLARQNKYDDVEALYTARVRSLRKSPGDEHPATLEALEALGGFYAGRRRFIEAEPIYRDLCEICRRVKGETDESTLRAASGLATALECQNRLTEAEALYTQGVQSRQTGSTQIRDLLSAEAELARFYGDHMRFAEAEKVYLQCYQDARRLLAKSDSKTAGYLQGLMTLYVAWGRPDRCEVVGADMQQFDVKTRLQLVADLTTSMQDHLESLFPTCRNLDAPQLTKLEYNRWQVGLLGRAVALGGDFDRAVRILRIPAERDRSTNGAWWYIVGGAELLAGRAEQARPAFVRARQGTNLGAADIARFFLAQDACEPAVF
jgi:non-specific serine/threonine protein kinase/serine/threonine-protein kinase